MMLQSLDEYYADSPIEDATADAFGRSSFATRMAAIVDQMGIQSKSSVAALVGSWGSGKSSVLNLFEARLLSVSPTWIIRRFNPWLFNDVDSLLVNYFSELVAAMPDGAVRESMRERIGGYLGRIAPIGKAGSIFGLDLEGAIESASGMLNAPKTLTDRKDDLAKSLGELDNRILIVMDDIDRLQPEELLLVLKLIRLIGELPNVHYLLAYDERTLLDVLMATPIGNNDEDRAAQYVDKMVQVRFDLPPLTEFQEENVFTPGYLKILDSIGYAIPNEEFRRLGHFYEEFMQDTLRVPRRINKYLAQLSAFLTAEIAQELNVVDFSILTYIRTFHGTLYARLIYWKSSLIGSGLTMHELTRGPDALSKRREHWTRRLSSSGIPPENIDGVLTLLGVLFPSIAELTDHIQVGGISAGAAALNKHLASAEYFDRYFQFAVPDNEISDGLVADALSHLLEGAEPTDSLSAVLDRMGSDPALVLEKCRLLTATHPCTSPRAMLLLLSDHYASYDWRDRRMFRSPQDLARYLAFDILRRMPESAREPEIQELTENGNLTFALDLARTIAGSSNGPFSWFNAYKDRLDARFRAYVEAEMASLETISYDGFASFRTWGQIASGGDARSFAQAKIRDGGWDLERYLAYLTGTSYLLGGQDPTPRLSGLDESWIEHFIGVDFAIAELGQRLNEFTPVPELYEVDEPTYDQRLRYALGILRELKDRRGDGT